MNILVTSGHGFIGSHLVERLIKENNAVTILDDQKTAPDHGYSHHVHAWTIDAADPKCEHIFIDVKFDVVFYLPPEALFLQNLKINNKIISDCNNSLNNILCFSQKHHVKKVIVQSSYQVYGRQTVQPVSETVDLKPSDPLEFLWTALESCCSAYRASGLDVVILRLGAVYGPGQPKNSDQMIQNILDNWLDGKTLPAAVFDPRKLDYIYINDAVDAMVRVMENQTRPVLNIGSGRGATGKELLAICSSIMINPNLPALDDYTDPDGDKTAESGSKPDMVLDNQQAVFELDWRPKYSLESGIMKTIEWTGRNISQVIPKDIKPDIKRSPLWRYLHLQIKIYPDIENILFFIVMTAATILLKTQLDIDLDLLILYIVLVNLYHGLKHGSIAIALAIGARIWIMFNVLDIRVIDLINTPAHIFYLLMYFIIGVGVGYVIDLIRQEKEIMAQEKAAAEAELDFTRQIYQKSIEVKQFLQETIEYNIDSLAMAFNTVNRLEQAEPSQIYQESARVLASTLKVNMVHLYMINETGEWLRLVSATGKERYGHSIHISQYQFLDAVVNQQTIFINKSLDPEMPMLCAPVYTGQRTVVAVFFDDVDFLQLTQNFINTLKVLTQLLANLLAKTIAQEETLKQIKYYPKTRIMKKEWFAELITSLNKSDPTFAPPSVILKIINQVPRYEAFNSKVAHLIRSTDYLGELSKGQLAIILTLTENRDIQLVFDRFAEHGYKLEMMNRGELLLSPSS